MGRNNEFFVNFERKKYLKKLPSMQRVRQMAVYRRTTVILKASVGEVVSLLSGIQQPTVLKPKR